MADVCLRERLIVAAAIKHDGMVCFVPRPGRHSDVLRQMAAAGLMIPINGEQGFVTSDGLFVDRRRAREIAFMAEQLGAKTIHRTELFSEDLW